ncbi:MAG: sodium:solute symporter, partial [Bacteroidota bacterium]
PVVLDLAQAENKFNLFDFRIDWQQPVFWVVLLGGVFSNIVFYGTDQTVVQRYITAKDLKAARRSVWTNALLVLPATLLFFSIGTLLFVYFKTNPTTLQPGLEANDAVFPWYIVSHLPQGVSGLLIAGVFAASMSSLSSSMNSVATAYTTDFHQRFNWKGPALRVARNSTLIVGVLGTLFAMLMATSDIKSLWDEFIRVVGLITGGLGGLFVLGMISRRANARGALTGLVASVIVQFWVAATEPVHLLLYTATGFISCLLVGYVSSLLFDESQRDEKLSI